MIKYFGSLTLAVMMVWLAACSDQSEMKSETTVVPVKVEQVALEKISLPIITSGILQPLSQMKLSFKTGGIIEQIQVDEGNKVKKGQLLARLNRREIDARVQQARSAFEKAQRDFERVERLYNDNVTTFEQFQNARTGLDMAKADLQVAQFNYEYSSIIAPADGRVLFRLAEVHEMIAMGQPLFVFAADDLQWLVRVGITERDILKLSIGDSAQVRFDAYPGEPYQAAISEIGQAAQMMNGTFEVELVIQKDHRPLKAGFVARVTIFPTQTEQWHTIPIEALIDADEEGGYVFSPGEVAGAVKKLPVKIAHIYKDRVAVRQGLEGVDQVITAGSAYLTEDSRITVVD